MPVSSVVALFTLTVTILFFVWGDLCRRMGKIWCKLEELHERQEASYKKLHEEHEVNSRSIIRIDRDIGYIQKNCDKNHPIVLNR